MKDDDDIVYRRIRPDWVKSFDPLALKSIAFQNLEEDNMSGHLGSILKEHQIPPESLLEGLDGYGLVWISVKELQEFGQEVVPHLDDENDPAHIHVVGKKNTGTKRRMAKAASQNVLVLPEKQ